MQNILYSHRVRGRVDNVSGATAGICRSEASAWLLAISIFCHHRKYFVPTIAANPAPVTALSPTQSQSQSPGTQYPGPRYCMHDESHVTLAQTITGVPTMQHHRPMLLLCGAGLVLVLVKGKLSWRHLAADCLTTDWGPLDSPHSTTTAPRSTAGIT